MKYKDRHNDKRRIIYWLRRHTDKLASILKDLEKK